MKMFPQLGPLHTGHCTHGLRLGHAPSPTRVRLSATIPSNASLPLPPAVRARYTTARAGAAFELRRPSTSRHARRRTATGRRGSTHWPPYTTHSSRPRRTWSRDAIAASGAVVYPPPVPPARTPLCFRPLVSTRARCRRSQLSQSVFHLHLRQPGGASGTVHRTRSRSSQHSPVAITTSACRRPP